MAVTDEVPPSNLSSFVTFETLILSLETREHESLLLVWDLFPVLSFLKQKEKAVMSQFHSFIWTLGDSWSQGALVFGRSTKRVKDQTTFDETVL